MAIRTWDNGADDGNIGTAANWSADTAPIASDTVVFDATNKDITAGLSTFGAVQFSRLDITPAFSGTIGDVSTSATNPTYAELIATNVHIGDWSRSTRPPTGSRRLLIDFKSTAVSVNVYQTPSTGLDTDLAPARFLFNSATATMNCKGPCNVAVAGSNFAETSTIGTVDLNSPEAYVHMGLGVTCTNLNVYNGTCVIEGFSNNVTVKDGTCIVKDSSGSNIVTGTYKVTGSGTLSLAGVDTIFVNDIELADGATLDLRGILSAIPDIKFTGTGNARIITDANTIL